MFGLLNVYKPPGMTSFDVVHRARRAAGKGVKTGHAGTLDPLAEGVLVICLGPATRLVGMIQDGPKEYVVVAELGATSTTDDREGGVTPTAGATAPDADAVSAAAEQFVGTIQQTPPAFSAVKIAGQPAYKLARKGQAPEITPRPVTIRAIEVLAYGWPTLRLRVACGSGTYIRSLVRDLGEALGVGGYCLEILRTRVGPFTADNACRIDDIVASDRLEGLLLDPLAAVPEELRITVDEKAVRGFTYGQAAAADLPPGGPDLLAAVGPDGKLAALVRPDRRKGLLRPSKVFVKTE